MKKKNLNSLTLNKKSISNLEISGGKEQYPTFQISNCGTCHTDFACPTWALCDLTKNDACQL